MKKLMPENMMDDINGNQEEKMKTLSPVFLLFAIFAVVIANAARNELWEERGLVTVVVERSSGVALGLLFNSRLEISAGGATLNYMERKVVIDDPKNIRGWYGDSGLIAAKIDFNQNQLVIHIPIDAKYHIIINDQEHVLTKVTEKEK